MLLQGGTGDQMVDSYLAKYVQTQAYVVLHERLQISVDVRPTTFVFVCVCVSCVSVRACLDSAGCEGISNKAALAVM